MNWVIYTATGVKKPEVSPAALNELSATFDVVRQAALNCQLQLDGAISLVLSTNQGEATEAFATYAEDSDAPRKQFERLADAALTTRDAHARAADLVTDVTTAMDAEAAAAASALVDARMLVPILRERHIRQVLARAKTNLEAIRDSAAGIARAIYQAVGLDELDLLTMTEAQARGSVPEALQDAWDDMDDPEDRMALFDAVAEDVMSDWPNDWEQPEVLYYSNQVPQPPGTIPPPNPDDDWSGYNGVASGGDIYINYDIMESGTTPTQLSTVVHEIQHIEQGHLRTQYDEMVAADPGAIDDIRAGRRPDPFVEHGSTVDEVERFQVPYEPARIDDESNPYYYHQPTEIDARRAGTEYLDNLSPEQIERLLG